MNWCWFHIPGSVSYHDGYLNTVAQFSMGNFLIKHVVSSLLKSVLISYENPMHINPFFKTDSVKRVVYHWIKQSCEVESGVSCTADSMTHKGPITSGLILNWIYYRKFNLLAQRNVKTLKKPKNVLRVRRCLARKHEEFLNFKYSLNVYLQFIYFNEFLNKLLVAEKT